MTTVDILVGAVTLTVLLFLGLYFCLALLQSRRAERVPFSPETDRRSSASTARAARDRAGLGQQTGHPGTGSHQGRDRRFDDQDVPDSAARGTWDLYAHTTSHRGEPATYRVRSTGQGAPKWNPYAEEQSRAHRARARRHRRLQFPRIDDHYSLLGLERGATPEEIERAYRRHAAQIHPDRFFDDPFRRAEAEKKLKQLNAVMQILRDPVRRAQYDERLSRREREMELRDEE